MKILAIAQVEDRTNLDKQIAKQTVKPDMVFFHVDDNPEKTIPDRRKRIAYNHHFLVEAVEELQPDLIWQLEGDCELPEYTLEKLLEGYELFKDIRSNKPLGYISGVQIGRHGLYTLGAWNIPKDQETFDSLDYKSIGYQEVDATGFYCLLAPKDIWLKGKCYWDGEVWGPDVNWGLSLSDRYTIYVDTELHIGHRVSRGIIWPSHASTCNVHFFKNDIGEWKYKTSE